MTELFEQPVSRKIFYTLIAALVGFSVIHLSLHYVNIIHFDEANEFIFELTNRFDFADETSIPTWYAQFLFLVGSFVAGALVFFERNPKSKRIWAILAVVLLVGSVDEVASLHESVLQITHKALFNDNSPTIAANAWIVISPFVIMLVGFFLYKAFKTLPKEFVVFMTFALAIYLLGAISVDILNSVIDERRLFEQGLMSALEETMELAGLTLLIYALISYMELYYGDKISKGLKSVS